MTSSKSTRGAAKAKPVRRAAPAVQRGPTASKASKTARRTATQEPVTIATSKASASTPKAPASKPKAPASKPDAPAGTSKLAQIISLLQRPDGASIAEICEATGWQTHSVRGAFAGTLKRKGHVITFDKVADVRRYRIEPQL